LSLSGAIILTLMRYSRYSGNTCFLPIAISWVAAFGLEP
jgi:hypothetical protein